MSNPGFRGASPSFNELFTPKLVSVLREGYGFANFRSDVTAGLTVAIVALPLSMAIAVASGVTPEKGLFTAIIGGFVVSALGGSRFQIGGPAGAFIILVAGTAQRHGVDGLILATMIAGLFLVAAGYLRLGTYIKFIPYPVTVGFTAGIAVIILASQLREMFGLELAGAEPGPLIEKLAAFTASAGTFNPSAFAIALLTIATIVAFKRLAPSIPGMLLALAAATIAAYALGLQVETIGSRFGDLPRMVPAPALPAVSLEKIRAVLPDAASFALLGAIESLLSAVVADGMTGRRHRSNCELVGQGFANIGSALFGGICVTGTIARTATNVRAGAHGPVAGMAHSVFLLVLLFIGAPLARYIPLAALGGVLAVVAWHMVEKQAIRALIRSSTGDLVVLATTFLLVIFRDLTEGIVVGFALGAILFIDRMGRETNIVHHDGLVAEDLPDSSNGDRRPYDAREASNVETVTYRLSGAFFFGAASTVGSVLDRISDQRRNFILDCSGVVLLDSTAANVLEGTARKAANAGIRFIISGTSAKDRRILAAGGVKPPNVEFADNLEEARAMLEKPKIGA